MSEGTPLLREAFNKHVVKDLAKRIKSVWSDFDQKGFVERIHLK